MKAWKVILPIGVEADGIWKNRTDIPEVWFDRGDGRFFTEDGDVKEVEVTEKEYRSIRDNAGQKDDL